MGMAIGIRRLGGDGWVALGVIAANAMFLRDLVSSEPDDAYVKTTTLPIVLSLAMIVLSLLLLGWSLRRPAGRQQTSPGTGVKAGGILPLVRVFTIIALSVVYIAALPWFGYLASSAAYIGGLSLMYGNRNFVPILAMMIGLPLVLMLFFEKYMIVLLPSARLFE